jgi:hypothetical protein
MVYRDRKKAESDCEDSNDMAHEMVGENHEGEREFDDANRRHRQSDPLTSAAPTWEQRWQGLRTAEESTFWEVIEVELEDV